MIAEVAQKEFFDTGLDTGFPLIDAVVRGAQVGKIFSDLSTPSNFFILHKANFGFIRSTLSSVDDFASLFEKNPLLPSYFHLYEPPTAFISELRKRPNAFNLRDRKRIRLLRSEKVAKEYVVGEETNVLAITDLNLDALDVVELGIGSKFWRSKVDFLANGFGVCLLDAIGSPLAVCYTACVAAGFAEIDIQTSAEHRGKGYGRIVTEAFVNMCVDRGLIASWDCFEENSASLRTAMAAGFAVDHAYQFISILNKSRQHE